MQDASTVETLQQENAHLRARVAELEQQLCNQDEECCRFRALAEHAPEGIGLVSLEGTLLYANPAYRRLSGYTDVSQFGLGNIFDEPPAYIQELIEYVLTHGEWSGVLQFRQVGGGSFLGQLSAVVIHDQQGQPRWLAGVVRDITQQLQIEDDLREIQARFDQLTSSIEQVFIIMDAPYAEVMYVSPAYETVYGMSCESLYANSSAFLEVVHPADRKRVQDSINQYTAGQPFDQEYRIVRHDGTVCWIWGRVFPLRDAQGQIYRSIAIAEDITERKQAQLALLASEERLQHLLSSSPVVIFSCQVSDGYRTTFMSSNVRHVLGYPASEFLIDPQTWNRNVHPDDDLDDFGTIMPLLEQGQQYTREYRFRHQDGTYRWMQDQVRLVRNGYGTPVEIIGSWQDISERKQLEHDMLQSQQRLDAFFTAAPAGLVLMDTDLRYLKINETVAQINGVPADEHLGRTVQEVLSIFGKKVAAMYRRVLQTGEPILNTEMSGETPAQPGVQRFWQASLFPIKNDAGEPVNLGTIFVEITEQKQAQMALQASEERLQHLLSSSPVIIFSSKAEGDYGATFVSANIRRVLGYEPHEFTEQSDFWASHIHPDDAPAVFANLSRLFEQNWHRQEYRFLHRDGTYRWMQNVLRLVRDDAGVPVEIIGSLEDISARKQAEEALRHSNERAATMLERITDAFFALDTSFRFTYLNQRAALLLQRPQYELLGKNLWEEFPEAVTLAFYDQYTQAMEQQVTVEFEAYFSPLVTWFEVHAYPSDDGLSVYFQDVTRRKETEEALKDSEARYRLLADNSSDMISLYTLEGECTYVSPACTPLLGYVPDDLLGHSAYDLFHPDDLPAIQLSHQTILAEPMTYKVGYRIRHKAGHYIWFETTSRAMRDPDSGAAQEIIAISRDISDRKQAEEALQQAKDELEQRVKERTLELEQSNILLMQEIEERARIERVLEEHRASLARQVAEQTADLKLANLELARAARLKDEFLANMSHELRTPLNAILGMSEALQEEVYGPLTTRQHTALQNIHESGHHLLEMINDILDLAKIGAGKVNLDIDITPVETVCDASLRFVQYSAYKKNITLFENVDPGIGVLYVDQRRLKQMLVNLLSNAVKFTPEGGQVGLSVLGDKKQRKIYFTVWDTGVGIAQADISKLFQPFVQIDSSLSRQYEGTGLGLALVARLAEMHGGNVAVESIEGEGSRFTITLPWNEQQSEPLAAEPGTTELAAVSLAKKTALVIEDSPSAADQINRYLSELGVHTVLSQQGKHAVNQAAELRPDIIILDILLPDTTGWKVLEQLKNSPATHNIPILVISVLNEAHHGQQLGAGDYLVKPISRAQLQQSLHMLLGSAPDTALASVAEPLPDTSEQGPLLLLAEDNQDNSIMLSEYLALKGYRCSVVHSGQAVLEAAQSERPDLILMDIQMPEMDGLEATRRIQAINELANIPIIALTALAMPGDRERCLQAGAIDYISKPVSLRQLLYKIQTHLNA